MDAERQDPVGDIEAAIAALRHAHRRGQHGFGPHGGFGGPPGMHGVAHGMHAMGAGRGRFSDVPGAARFRMLDALQGGPSSVSALAEAIGVDQPRASRLVADAAMRGFVDRRPDPVDARRMVVELTAPGRTALEGMKASRRSTIEDALAGFTPDERTAFAGLLTRFVAALPRGR